MARTKSNGKGNNERRKLIYATVVNKFNDTTLAVKARGWGDKRLKEELGIKLPKTTPVIVKTKTSKPNKKVTKTVVSVQPNTTKNKKSKKSSNNNKRRKLIYAVIINQYGDTKLASKARGWSDTRLKEELGIKLPKTTPVIVKDKQTRQEHQDKYLLYETILEQNEDIEPTELLKEVNNKRTSSLITKYLYDKNKTKKTDRRTRIDKWVKWSKDKSYPKELEALAKYYNKLRAERTGRTYADLENDDDLHAGWIIVYQAYLSGETTDTWFKKLQFNRWNSNIYLIETVV